MMSMHMQGNCLWGVREFLRVNTGLSTRKKMKALLSGEYKPRKTCECGYPLLEIGKNGAPMRITFQGVELQCPDCGRRYIIRMAGVE